MNLPSQWFPAFIKFFLALLTKSAAHEETAQFGVNALRAQRALAAEAVETLQAADGLKVGDDAYRKEVADLLSSGVADVLRTYKRVSNFEMSGDEGREALEANPFSQGSAPAAPLSPPAAGPKALAGEAEGQGVVKRPVGRPPGAKNRPRPALFNPPAGEDRKAP